MQVFPAWSPPGGTLGEILRATRTRLDGLRQSEPTTPNRPHGRPLSFARALGGGTVAVIAELKRRSPSAGDLNPDLNLRERTAAYVVGGAAALSVVTEPFFFSGSSRDLSEVVRVSSCPVLRKDFHIDAIQLAEARALGASAALLIARALDAPRLRAMVREAIAHELEPLVEVRTEAELDVALSTDAPMIGVNSRDLETLRVDVGVSERLLPLIPRDRVAIAESGVRERADVQHLASFGADAVLVGSALSAARDPSDAVHRLTGVARSHGRAT